MADTTNSTSTPAPKKKLGANIRLYTFVSKVITPAVLLLGVVFLAVFHFKGVLANTVATDNLYRDQQSYSMGPLSYTFQTQAGTSRPDVSYNGISLLTYVDWSSTISIDGHVSTLWNNYHGYDYDRQNPNAKEFFSTTSGTGFQVVEVATLTSDHTVTIQYSFVALPQGVAEAHQVILTIEHFHQTWYQPNIQNNTFTAGVLSHQMTSVTSGNTPTPLGTLTLSISGPAVPQQAIAFDDTQRGNQNATGANPVLTDSFSTTYIINNPDVNRLTPLGTETITFTPGSPPGTPISAPLPVITPTV